MKYGKRGLGLISLALVFGLLAGCGNSNTAGGARQPAALTAGVPQYAMVLSRTNFFASFITVKNPQVIPFFVAILDSADKPIKNTSVTLTLTQSTFTSPTRAASINTVTDEIGRIYAEIAYVNTGTIGIDVTAAANPEFSYHADINIFPDPGYFRLTADTNSIAENGIINLTARLLDEDENPIVGAPLWLIVAEFTDQDDITTTNAEDWGEVADTDESGEAEFMFAPTTTGDYTLEAYLATGADDESNPYLGNYAAYLNYEDLYTMESNYAYYYDSTIDIPFYKSFKSNSVIIPVFITPGLPNAPSNCVATFIDSETFNPGTNTFIQDDHVDIFWVDNSNNETGFSVERRIGANGSWTEIPGPSDNNSTYTGDETKTTTEANVTTASDYNFYNMFEPGVTYSYRVRAFNDAGYSAYSNVVSVTVVSVNAPSNCAAYYVREEAGGEHVDVFWRDNSSNEYGFSIERREGSGGVWTEVTESPTVLGNDYYTVSDDGTFTSGATYYYRVRAYSETDYSAYSNEASVIIPTVTEDTTLSAPTNLTAVFVVASPNRMDLYWNDNSTTETGFAIERKISTGGVWTEITNTVPANTTLYGDTLSFSPGTTYYYRIRAIFESGYSPYSAEVAVTTQSSFAPVDPSNLTLEYDTTNDYFYLYWHDNSDSETNYIVEERITSGGTWAVLATLGPNIMTYAINVSGYVSGTTYYYRVRASNAYGFSDYSNEKNEEVD